MRRDNQTVFAGNDNLGFIFDTFYDRRNSAFFTVNLVVGDNFNPEVGFLRRDDMRRSFGQFRGVQ